MIHLSHDIPSGDYDRGGLASRGLKEQLKQIGASPRDIRRAMIAAYEAEMNVVIHSAGGRMNVSLDSQRLEVEVADDGPGIADTELAMKEGFSTAPATAREMGFGAGMGLPNIRKNSDVFGLDSSPAGTKVRFTIFLTPARTAGEYRHSLSIADGKCKQCLACLRACPTRAMRVRGGGPKVLDYLCIDCTACIGCCDQKVLGIQAPAAMEDVSGATLVVPAAALAQFGPGQSLHQVLDAIRELGFADVQVTQPAEDALRAASLEFSKEFRMGSVISPCCPAVVNLIQTRFASLLPHVAPYVPAIEAMTMNLHGRRVQAVVTCPAQRSILSKLPQAPQVVTPSALRAAVMPILASRSRQQGGESRAHHGQDDRSPMPADDRVMRVSGIHHVAEVLERLENGLLEDVPVLELWACDEGCFGSPLLAEEANLSERRCAGESLQDAGVAHVARREESLAARAGLRLDEEMTKAIVKFSTIAKIIGTLPGHDCGMCGCPTCGTMAEDIVMGRAGIESCPYLSGKGR